jgi:ribonuclease T2
MRLPVLIALWILAAGTAAGQDRGPSRPGAFDYYLLALSWSPSWCALTGDDRADPQCDAGRGLGFTVHGLWPQHEMGYPSDCFTHHPDPSRAQTAAMADILGGAGLAFYEWRKHGRCSGLSAAEYFATLRRAHAGVTMPAVFDHISRDLQLDPQVIEDAFLEVNPGLTDAMMTVTCKADRIQELRLCLTRDLAPRDCAPDVARDCTLPSALLEAPR